MTRSSALVALLAVAPFAIAPAASAQTSDYLTPASARLSPSTAAYAGLYATDGGMVEVRPSGAGIALVAYGAPVAARLRALAATDDATDARTETLLEAWIAGDLDAVASAARPARQPATAQTLAAYRAALVRGHGRAVAGSVVGTFWQIDGRKATLVQVLFERGTEWAAFVWDEDGALVTVTRGLSPVTLGTVRPSGADAFGSGPAAVTFDREADGRIASVRVGEQFTALR